MRQKAWDQQQRKKNLERLYNRGLGNSTKMWDKKMAKTNSNHVGTPPRKMPSTFQVRLQDVETWAHTLHDRSLGKKALSEFISTQGVKRILQSNFILTCCVTFSRCRIFKIYKNKILPQCKNREFHAPRVLRHLSLPFWCHRWEDRPTVYIYFCVATRFVDTLHLA